MNAHMIESPLANVRELDQALFRECFAELAKWFQDPAVAYSGGRPCPFFGPRPGKPKARHEGRASSGICSGTPQWAYFTKAHAAVCLFSNISILEFGALGVLLLSLKRRQAPHLSGACGLRCYRCARSVQRSPFRRKTSAYGLHSSPDAFSATSTSHGNASSSHNHPW